MQILFHFICFFLGFFNLFLICTEGVGLGLGNVLFFTCFKLTVEYGDCANNTCLLGFECVIQKEKIDYGACLFHFCLIFGLILLSC
jgi:hypothetical protein